MNNTRYRTAEVARFAEVTLRQLQVWEEKRVAMASRSGRVRLYSVSEALFVMVLAELRRRGLSLQRLRRLSPALRQVLGDNEVVVCRRASAFVLTDGHQVQFADTPNKTLDSFQNFFRPIVCVNIGKCLERLEKKEFAE
jgi:DNA-binding transcriptional MerR regulator